MGWQIKRASVTGTSHSVVGHGCDDACHVIDLKNGTILLAVADGAGSALWSAVGAKKAVKDSLEFAKKRLLQEQEPQDEAGWITLLEEIAKATHSGLEKEERLFPSELATTLLLAIVTPTCIAISQIGDGAIIVQGAGSEDDLRVLTRRGQGEYINETHFITDVNYSEHLYCNIQSSEDIRGIALFTDGLEMAALRYATYQPHPGFFVPLFKFAANRKAKKSELEQFLESEKICKRTNDDKTIILAVKNGIQKRKQPITKNG